MTPEEAQQLKNRVTELEKALSFFTFSDKYSFQRSLQMFDERNIILGHQVGTKIGTEATQKLSFYGLTPITQPLSTGETTGASAVDVLNNTTFNGNNGATAYTILDIVKHLKNLGILKK